MAAGVSRSTVSRCFRLGGFIASATCARVPKAARELGYQPDAIASGLSRRLGRHDDRVLLFALDAQGDVDAALDQVWRYRVDGAIVAARLSPGQMRAFDRHRVLVVLNNRVADVDEPAPSVRCDSRAANGCWLIGGPEDNLVARTRAEAVCGPISAPGPRSLDMRDDRALGGDQPAVRLEQRAMPGGEPVVTELLVDLPARQHPMRQIVPTRGGVDRPGGDQVLAAGRRLQLAPKLIGAA